MRFEKIAIEGAHHVEPERQIDTAIPRALFCEEEFTAKAWSIFR